MNRIISFKIIAICIILSFISCSKDSEEPTKQETPVTVTTADFSTTMDENPKKNQVIGIISGSTNTGKVIFSTIEQMPSGAFTVDATSGELRVLDEKLFAFDTNPVISGTVKVANGDVSQNASVTITLNELNKDKVFNGSVVLFTQEEVDAFGVHNYTHINGAVMIGTLENEMSTILTLSPLIALKEVSKHFIIYHNGLLENLNGLENLEHLGDNLFISTNPSLTNISALSNIRIIEKSLSIDGNNVLITLKGLENTTDVREGITIRLNDKLTDISLSKLSNVGLDLKIERNKKLEKIDFPSLTEVPRKLTISWNDSLKNLDGLSYLNIIGGDLEAIFNLSLSDFCGLSNVFMGGYFQGKYTLWSNEYNPTQQDLIDGNCKL